MPETDEQKGATQSAEDKRAEYARRRSAGEAFDERMKEMTRDAPRPARPDQERRRKR
jgi:hypothetical protein